ncbi:Na(+)/H(+) exchange regulatory cofactor-like protein nrfl-1 [Caenorhabditis elegans]|uniref:Na(+)/H(+) exchange regulatory cofactor-like protein nrfl-1 n=1 Tax=Caenorhabditis elegans TaxID=6239 RepID=NHRF1_CAEEL|nr:Na(+)/H(+) exchange regulatory cofactor-like protein nrfl-1 [Caenorhabditis elegans]G5EDM4.1 RecName: Full=Na(+)/H(+) exchange regulatory cofactor-like protein nrfl-1; Short=NHERF-1; AltName: Full=Regulatory cofactor of Na(+)/H(+) exchanger; AltName: Full=Sodium-hydrogen exchanger regulatory factor 1 [Caenorhabditis elegans]CAA92439.3 Na(+)/H(+) exchange regulatory cofactor-like protein nrfl-1 [Caenorhabditis elegans]|eukprot:NP_741478.1 NHERF (mammalian Na/H Exchange Regulatory Factor) Like [Caenorhabditis elegans]
MVHIPSDVTPPRLCVVEKLNGENEYGYNLHAEKGRGQFVGTVDPDSPAERGGLITGDRIFAVNGHSIIGENHKKVVERIKANPNRCEMLVISEEGAKWYNENNVQITLDLPNIERVSPMSKETPVFVPPPPPPTDAMPYLPRLAELNKGTPDQEFGFNLHAERGRGHFIGTVDAGGIGEKAGLEAGQRIVGVNGQLIYPTTGHKEVVALIKKDTMKTTLLVASEDVDKYHKDHNIAYSWDNVERVDTRPVINVETHHHHEEVSVPKSNGYDVPPLNPHSIQVNEEREISKMTTTTRTETITNSNSAYQYKESSTAYDAYATPPVDSNDLMDEVFGRVNLPGVTMSSHTEVLPPTDDISSVSSLSSHRESAVDVPVSHQYVPSYATESHQKHEQHSQTHHHHHQHQQPSPLSNGSSHGYAASSTSGYDDDDIYHLSAREARERLRMKNRKHHLHEMSLNEKYQLVSNM